METKKAFKRDKIQQIVSYCPKTPQGAIFLFGKIGSGKTLAMLTLAQRFHDFRNLKIFDMWGGERNQGENLYWVLPSEFKNYWNYWKKKIRLDEVGQKQYKVSLLYPLFRKLPKEVPKLESYVFPNVFRIPIKSITLLEIKCVIGSLSSSDETLWENITYKLNKSDGSAELTKLFEKEKATNTSLYRNFVYPLIEEGLLCSMDDPDALDVGKEMRDKEVISVLVHHYVPEKFNVFILSWFLFRIWDLSKIGKVPRDIIPLIREASKFFRATDKSVIEDKYKIFKRYLEDFLRYARGKIHPIMDSQSPAETKNFLEGNQDLSIIGLLPGAEDRAFATEQFKRDGSMVDSQIRELSELEPGEYYFVTGKGKLAKKKYLLLPRTMYWRESDGNFYDIWKNKHGSKAFFNSSEIYKNAMKKHNDKLSELNKIQEQHKEEKKITQDFEEEKRERESEDKNLERYRRELEGKKKIREEIRRKNRKVKTIKMIGDSEQIIEEKDIEEKEIKDEVSFEDYSKKMKKFKERGREE